MGDPESGPVWLFQMEQHRGGNFPVEVLATQQGRHGWCLSVLLFCLCRRRRHGGFPMVRKLGARTTAIHSLVVVTCMHNNIICLCRLTGLFAWRRASIAFGRVPCGCSDTTAWTDRLGQHEARLGGRIELR